MKKIMVALVSIMILLLGTACGAETPGKKGGAEAPKAQASAAAVTADKNAAAGSLKLKITARGKTLTAVMENNPTVQAFAKKLPATLKMENLYDREMCYHRHAALRQIRSGGYHLLASPGQFCDPVPAERRRV